MHNACTYLQWCASLCTLCSGQIQCFPCPLQNNEENHCEGRGVVLQGHELVATENHCEGQQVGPISCNILVGANMRLTHLTIEPCKHLGLRTVPHTNCIVDTTLWRFWVPKNVRIYHIVSMSLLQLLILSLGARLGMFLQQQLLCKF